MNKNYYVYIMGSDTKTIYIGITSDLVKRVYEHQNNLTDGFTKKYNVKKLLYFETFSDPENAIIREKKIKGWNRQWKLDLIQKSNPELRDLYSEIV